MRRKIHFWVMVAGNHRKRVKANTHGYVRDETNRFLPMFSFSVKTKMVYLLSRLLWWFILYSIHMVHHLFINIYLLFHSQIFCSFFTAFQIWCEAFFRFDLYRTLYHSFQFDLFLRFELKVLFLLVLNHDVLNSECECGGRVSYGD